MRGNREVCVYARTTVKDSPPTKIVAGSMEDQTDIYVVLQRPTNAVMQKEIDQSFSPRDSLYFTLPPFIMQ